MGLELGMDLEVGMDIHIGVFGTAGISGAGTTTINARPAHRRPIPVASATIESSEPSGAIANYGAGAGRRQSGLNRRRRNRLLAI
jgi:hypothetical protein